MLNTILSGAGQMFGYALVAIFIENTILSRALGTSTSLWTIRKKYSILLFGAVLTIITTVTSALAYALQPFIKSLNNSYYVLPLIYVAIISVVYILMLLITNRLKLKQKKTIRIFIHRCAFNCAVLGGLLLSTQANLSLLGFIGFGIGTGIGFTLATALIDFNHDKLHGEHISKAFRGFPAILIYIGILSLAVYGMIGGHELPI